MNLSNAPSSNRSPALFYIFSQDQQPSAPQPVEAIAHAVLTGRLAEQTLVARVGAPTWSPLGSYAEIAAALQAARTTPSSMRPSALSPAAQQPISIPPPAPLPVAPLPVEAKQEKAEEKKDDKKDEKKEPPLDPRFKWLPLGIFGAFAFIGLIETIVVIAMR